VNSVPSIIKKLCASPCLRAFVVKKHVQKSLPYPIIITIKAFIPSTEHWRRTLILFIRAIPLFEGDLKFSEVLGAVYLIELQVGEFFVQ
jgi:hypothetical protein